jgi:adenosine deaminase
MRRFQVYTAACAAIFLTASAVTVTSAQDKQASGAGRAAQALERIRSEPPALRDFLKRMPKGADLHSHLSGAVYAETHIRDAIADGLCVDQDAKAFAKSQPVIAGAELEPVCEQDQVPATELPKNQPLYNAPRRRTLWDAGRESSLQSGSALPLSSLPQHAEGERARPGSVWL